MPQAFACGDVSGEVGEFDRAVPHQNRPTRISGFGRAALARGLVAFACDVFAYRGDGFCREALDDVQVVAGQNEDADTVLDG